MRKIVVILALSVFCAGVSAQIFDSNLPLIQINVQSYNKNHKVPFGTAMTDALEKTDRYLAAVRDEDDLKSIADEEDFGISEEIEDDGEGTVKLAEYICNVKIEYNDDPGIESNQITARVIHRKSKVGIVTTRAFFNDLKNKKDYADASSKLVDLMRPKLDARWAKVDSVASRQKLRDNTKTYPDNRDGKTYRFWDDGKGAKWFMQDLGYGSGRYDISEYITACPVKDGWRVPNERDWSEWKRKMDRPENADLKKRFYETRDNRKRNYEKGLYWWSATPNQCVDDVKGAGCENSMDIIRIEVGSKLVGYDTKKYKSPPIYAPDTTKYRYWPQIRCVHD